MRRGIVAFAVFAAMLAPAVGDADRGMGLFKAGKFLEAASEFQAVVDRTPDDQQGWFMLGYCMLKMARPAEAAPMFRRALALDPSQPDFYQGLALALRGRGLYAEAVDVLEAGEAVASDPRIRFGMLSLRGSLNATLERWAMSAADLEQATAIKADPVVLAGLGRAYMAMGRDGEAAGALARAVDLRPDDAEIRRSYVEALLRHARRTAEPEAKKPIYAEALRHAEIYARAAGGSAEALNLVGRAALGAGRLEEAERSFSRVLESEPRHCYAMVNLAQVHIARTAWSVVDRWLQRAAACAPRLAAVHETRGFALLQQGRWAEARDAFLKARRIEPSAFSEAGLTEAARQLDSEVRRVGGPPDTPR